MKAMENTKTRWAHVSQIPDVRCHVLLARRLPCLPRTHRPWLPTFRSTSGRSSSEPGSLIVSLGFSTFGSSTFGFSSYT